MRHLALGVATAFTAATALHAQKPQPEARVDVLGPTPYSMAPGVGLIFPFGYYVRAGAAVGYAVPLETRPAHDQWSADLIARVTLDPFREQRWALSVGGGLSFRRRTFLTAIVDLEGPEKGGVLPALQIGLSGGFRAAVILRRAVPGRR